MLLIDGSAIAAHILGILGHIGVIVDDVLGGGHGHFLQGVHVVVVDRVGAPGVQLRQVLASGVDVALGHVHGDGVHVAVHEDDVGVSVPHRQVAVLAVDAGQEHVLVGILVLLNADHVAVGVQDHIVGDVLHIGVVILIQHFLVIHDGVGVVILGTAGGNILLQAEVGDAGVGQDLGSVHGLDHALGDGHQEQVVLSHFLDGEVLAVHRDGLLLGLILVSGLHVDGLAAGAVVVHIVDIQVHVVVLLVVVLGGLGQIGVDDGHGDLVVLGVQEHLGQHAVAGPADGLVVLLHHVGLAEGGITQILILAVHIDEQGVVINGGLAQQVVQVLAGDLGGVLGHHLVEVHIGADLGLLPGPGVGRTAEVVGGVLQSQVGLILLSELNRPAVLHVVGGVVDRSGSVVDVAGHVGGLGSADSNSGAVDGDVGALVFILYQGGFQSVDGIQAGLLTGGGTGANKVLIALSQTGLDGAGGHIDGPVGAGEALDGAVITQSGQQHFQEGKAGQLRRGPEGAIGVAVDQAGLHAVGDVAGKGGTHGHVLKGRGLGAQGLSRGLAKHHAGDDLGGSATGQGSLGLESTAGIAVDDSHFGHHVDSFRIGFAAEVFAVCEVLGTGADSDQRHGHHQSKHQRKELLHWDFSSF